jgi:pimeloyl-ACP methyl ester carboxylesterase
MTTYVLVHGGGHGGWCYQWVARLLRSAGHEVYTPTLTTRDPELMKEARARGRLWDVDTGHDLTITEPDQVAEALLQVALAGVNPV